MSDYSRWGKAYYQNHREEILAAEKDKKRWLEYYQKNKEAIAERNRRRYYEKKGLPVPAKDAPRIPRSGRPPNPNEEIVKRFEQLVAELRDIAPQVMRKKKTKKAKGTTEEPEVAPVNTVEWDAEIVDDGAEEVAPPGMAAI